MGKGEGEGKGADGLRRTASCATGLRRATSFREMRKQTQLWQDERLQMLQQQEKLKKQKGAGHWSALQQAVRTSHLFRQTSLPPSKRWGKVRGAIHVARAFRPSAPPPPPAERRTSTKKKPTGKKKKKHKHTSGQVSRTRTHIIPVTADKPTDGAGKRKKKRTKEKDASELPWWKRKTPSFYKQRAANRFQGRAKVEHKDEWVGVGVRGQKGQVPAWLK